MAAGGVWVFREDGVMELKSAGVQPSAAAAPSKKALVYVPANETMRSLDALEQRLGSLGWERYYENRDIVQLHRHDGGVDLIALPRDFARFRSTHITTSSGRAKITSLR
ncbi:flowering-promoting factor 1-like protein 5 [Hordeum vulgare subsp. vulgare]|uniref:flowering-promoting factor 1-like protein 5 n=1 Tax=Hordeum vulgare subsp. vulgare TaxID=112509 RepID=UPI001D1A58CA|nr:flowering-promoting factor 1-like protein 5 [Hordeum vulgare subsp. vulgare]